MTIEELHDKATENDAAKELLDERDASGEVADEDLGGVAGGAGERVCPKCGSTRIYYEPANHCSMCADCDYMLI